MAELIGYISKEARQVGNALLTGRDIFIGFKKEKHKPNMFQSVTLVGLSALIPEDVKASGILKNPARISAINAIEQYIVVLNDRIDFEGSGRQDIGDLIRPIHDLERSRRVELDQALVVLPENEQEWVRRNTETAISEIEFVEAWIREKQETNNISFSDVDSYRATVNAVYEVAGSSVIFGPGHLQDRVTPNEGQMNIQKVIDKYAWLSGTQPRNEIERAMMASHNMLMAMQIIDDRAGVDIDQLLKVPTYAIVALRVSEGDKKSARTLLNLKEKEYKEKAVELGAGLGGGEVVLRAFALAEAVLNRLPAIGRRHAWARRVLEKRHFGMREKAYMDKKI
ncbi:MAG: hypothetical protein Q7R82_02490 [Candidatus Daviesbacteria bacterium]|nr:hypothetical protein [Candidatus Daviesbacteria bacterium]